MLIYQRVPLHPQKMRKQITIYIYIYNIYIYNIYKLPLNFILRFWCSIFLGVAGGQSGGNMRKPCILLLLESIFRTYMHMSRAWFKTQDLSTRRFWDMVMFIRRVSSPPIGTKSRLTRAARRWPWNKNWPISEAKRLALWGGPRLQGAQTMGTNLEHWTSGFRDFVHNFLGFQSY